MFLNPSHILDQISVPLGAKVGDFGAGAGHFTLQILDRAGSDATIYALDAFVPALEKLERTAKKRGARIYTIESDFNRHIPLQDNLLQLAILANTLHQVRERERFVGELGRVLSPAGRVLVVDWVSSFNNMGPTAEAAVTPSEAIRLFRNQGFDTGAMLPAGSHHYAFVATSPL